MISDEQDSMYIENPYNDNQAEIIEEKSLEDSCSMIVEPNQIMYAYEGQQTNKNKLCLNR